MQEFEAGALQDTAERQRYTHKSLRAGVPEDLSRLAERAGAKQIILSYMPEGYIRDWIKKAAPSLDAYGIIFTELHRPWDQLIWPNATAGFFKVKKNIPNILNSVGLL